MRQLAAIAAFAAAVALLPAITSSGVVLNIAIMTLYAALLGQAWNLLAGFGGQFSFGHAVFFGSGASLKFCHLMVSTLLYLMFGKW